VARELPSGTVKFLFTDVEGSTRLLHELGAEGYAEALAEHRRILRESFAAAGGVEVDTQGDAFFVTVPTAPARFRLRLRQRQGSPPVRYAYGWASTPVPRVLARRATSGWTFTARHASPPAATAGRYWFRPRPRH
jgi:class 3 adenylate cyclase